MTWRAELGCPHAARSVSADGYTYCLACGLVLGLGPSSRPCGCPADPWVFGHAHKEGS